MAWLILTLVFVDELLAIAAAGIWGAHVGGWPLSVAASVVTVAVWWAFASPKAPYGGVFTRPVAKTLVFTLASAGLWAAGQPAWALALIVFSILINALAQLRPVVDLQREFEARN